MKNFQGVAVDAIEIIETLVRQFPGLLDGDQDVSGSELVSALTEAIQKSKNINKFLEKR